MTYKKTPFLESNGFKTFKNFLFGVGAAVVIVGAWAKLTHQPWANMALTVGLMTEAFIFALSGVVPPVKDYYWEKLYPGLDQAGGEFVNMSGVGSSGAGAGGTGSTAALDKMLDEAKIDQSIIDRLGDNLNRLSDNVNSLANVANAQVATEEFTVKTKKAAEAISNQAQQTVEALALQTKHTTEILAEQAKQTTEVLASQTKATTDAMSALTSNLDNLSKVYGNMLSAMRS